MMALPPTSGHITLLWHALMTSMLKTGTITNLDANVFGKCFCECSC